MVTGVTSGYEKTLEIQGVGYRAAKQGKKFLTDLKDDSEESGAEGVPAAPAPAVETPESEDGEKNDTPEARMTNARSMVADLLGKKKEG